MQLTRILLVIASYTILAASGAQAQNAPAHTAIDRPAITRVVLVGAHWCAPCRAELPELGTLASTVAPARITLGWTDRKPLLAANLAGTIEVLSVMAARDLADRHGAAARGVPFALAYGPDGTVCTVWRGPLKPADWPKLEQACRAG